jgi:uncharacterized damage-inducible protein DinB
MHIRFAALMVIVAWLGLAQAPTSPGDFQQEFLLSFSDAETKITSLAKALPAEKYSWRPGLGVRSAGEVYVHIANGNRLLISLLSGMPPRDEFMKLVQANEQREKAITEKTKVIADLEASFKQVHTALEGATGADLSKSIKFFGEDTTPRAVYMSILEHVSEHLGQSIAYARMNGIVPPWSREPGGQ